LEVGDEKIEQKRLSSTRPAQDHRVCHVAIVEIQEIRRVVIGLKNGEIFLPEMMVPGLARVEREEKRKVRVVRVQQIQVP
jgi:hypothetical protein